MPVLITSNFDDDLIKNERASMEPVLAGKDASCQFIRFRLSTAFFRQFCWSSVFFFCFFFG